MTVYWRPHHKMYFELPAEQDFLAFDEAVEKSIGRVSLEKHSANVGSRTGPDQRPKAPKTSKPPGMPHRLLTHHQAQTPHPVERRSWRRRLAG